VESQPLDKTEISRSSKQKALFQLTLRELTQERAERADQIARSGKDPFSRDSLLFAVCHPFAQTASSPVEMRTSALALSLYVCSTLSLAQDKLSLSQAVQLALRQNQSIASAQALVKASEAHTQSAHSGYLPSLNYTESATRSNNPVFVFSSLLTEHQFTASNFELGPLEPSQFAR
jgi:hypothetical protein